MYWLEEMLFLWSAETCNSIKYIKYLFRTFSICGTKLGPVVEIQRGMTFRTGPSRISQPRPWLGDSAGWNLVTKRWWIWFPLGAHTQVVGSILSPARVAANYCFSLTLKFLSIIYLSLSLPHFLKVNKVKKNKKQFHKPVCKAKQMSQ